MCVRVCVYNAALLHLLQQLTGQYVQPEMRPSLFWEAEQHEPALSLFLQDEEEGEGEEGQSIGRSPADPLCSTIDINTSIH